MNAEQAGELAHTKAQEFLNKLPMSESEREAVRSLFMRTLKSLNENHAVWKQIETEQIRLEVFPFAAAMLTSYTDELVRAMCECHQLPSGGRLKG